MSLQHWLNVIVMARSVVLYAFAFCTAAVVCNLMAGSCKMSRQPNHHHHRRYRCLCPLSSTSSIYSLSSLIHPSSRLSSSSACQTSISHVPFLSVPSFSSFSTSWYLCGKVCLHKQLVVHFFGWTQLCSNSCILCVLLTCQKQRVERLTNGDCYEAKRLQNILFPHLIFHRMRVGWMQQPHRRNLCMEWEYGIPGIFPVGWRTFGPMGWL